MNQPAIPDWNLQGIIPPINSQRPTDISRSPYIVSLSEFALRFGQSAERRVVLDGLLRYRTALHDAGLIQGFQWLDGSFLENIEALEARPPNDIDVVTFYDLPAGKSQMDLLRSAADIFPTTRDGKLRLKSDYHVDAYLEHLGKPPTWLIKKSAYCGRIEEIRSGKGLCRSIWHQRKIRQRMPYWLTFHTKETRHESARLFSPAGRTRSITSNDRRNTA